jgi:hypothetical protein
LLVSGKIGEIYFVDRYTKLQLTINFCLFFHLLAFYPQDLII